MAAAWMEQWQRNDARAIVLAEEALSIWHDLDDRTHDPFLFNLLGMAAEQHADVPRSLDYFERALVLAREIGDNHTHALLLNNLGNALRDSGDLDASARYIAEGLEVSRAVGDPNLVALLTGAFARLLQQQGDHRQALPLYNESLALFRDAGSSWGMALMLARLAMMAQLGRDPQRSARLFGAAEAQRERIGAPMSIYQRKDHEPHIAAARAALGDELFGTAWAAGHALSLDAAIAEALDTSAGSTLEPPDQRAHLTVRELDVLRLVATGMTDAEVAERLYLSRRTVSSHLTSIYVKLGVATRAAATRYAADHHLV